jgi:hypothetical protein
MIKSPHTFQRLYTLWEKATALSRKRARWLVYAFMLAAFIYLGAILYFSGLEIRTIPVSSWGFAGLQTLFLYLAALLIQSFVWTRLLACHHTISWEEFWIYFKLLVLRRLPGGVLHWFGRAAMYTHNNRVSSRTVLWGNFLEWAMLILVAGSLVIAGITAIQWPFRIALATVPFIVAVYLAVLWQPGDKNNLKKIGEGVLLNILYSATWLIGGLVIFLFARATGANGPGLWDATWIWAISGGSSLVLLIIPSGLGIREVTLTLLLQPYMSPSMAILVALLIRFSFTLADLLWGSMGWGISYLIHWNRKKKLEGSSNIDQGSL